MTCKCRGAGGKSSILTGETQDLRLEEMYMGWVARLGADLSTDNGSGLNRVPSGPRKLVLSDCRGVAEDCVSFSCGHPNVRLSSLLSLGEEVGLGVKGPVA